MDRRLLVWLIIIVVAKFVKESKLVFQKSKQAWANEKVHWQKSWQKKRGREAQQVNDAWLASPMHRAYMYEHGKLWKTFFFIKKFAYKQQNLKLTVTAFACHLQLYKHTHNLIIWPV